MFIGIYNRSQVSVTGPLVLWLGISTKRGNCTICVAKTKALISFAVTVKLICAFNFAYVDCWFSSAAAHLFSFFSVYTGSEILLYSKSLYPRSFLVITAIVMLYALHRY